MGFSDASDDKQIVEGCLAGDRRAWNAFVDRFSKLIYWSIHETLKDSSFSTRKDLPEEVFQEVFGRLFEKDTLSKLRDVQSIRRYLNVIACHATLDRIKLLTRHERKILPVDVIDWTKAQTIHEPQANETAALIEEILGELNPKEKACIELFYISEHTHRQIAQILGMPQDTVSTLIRRSRDKIKTELEKRGFGS